MTPMIAEVQLTNTLSGKKEKLTPKTPGEVTIYSCGPTVYGLTHVGNARAAVSSDTVVRVLKIAGYQVKFARNITDIDDKIIKVANETGSTWDQVAKKFTGTYESEIAALNIQKADFVPKATENIKNMHSMIEALISKGLAYVAETPYGNDVYYSVTDFKNYGCLTHRKIEDMMTGARIEPGEQKKNPVDFALWKAAKPDEPSWDSPWGKGRPGWHIECSAMIEGIFGDGIDIHMGGIDLIFPHHENEIAQSEGLSGKPLATYWVHNGLLNFGREKMSKSLGNIFTTAKFLELYGAETLRLLFMQHHFRSPMDFSDEGISRSEALLERLYSCVQKMQEHKNVVVDEALLPSDLKNIDEQMRLALFDDFNTAKALGILLKAVRVCFREQKPEFWAALKKPFNLVIESMGIFKEDPTLAISAIKKRHCSRLGVTPEMAESIEKRLAAREEARKQKNFAESDRLRVELESEGILVMDGQDGAAWSVKAKS